VLLDVVAVLRGGDRQGRAVHGSLGPVVRRAQALAPALSLLEVVIGVVGVALGEGEGALAVITVLLACNRGAEENIYCKVVGARSTATSQPPRKLGLKSTWVLHE
jgi:hypothetical protein